MDFRKVIKIKNSYYINIPHDVYEAMEVQAGERLKISHAEDSGTIIIQKHGAGEISLKPKNIEELKRAADFIYSRAAKKLKLLEERSISDYHTAMFKEISKLGIFELQRKVDGLEKRVGENKKGRGKLTLIHLQKKSGR